MNSMISYRLQVEIQQLALQRYPKTVMGALCDDRFVEITADSLEHALKLAGERCARAFIYSRAMLNFCPNEAEMLLQSTAGIAFGIMGCNGSDVTQIAFWGSSSPVQPLVGRPFVHGVWDCYAIIKDTFKTGRQGLKEQGISSEWPLDPIELPNIPRSDAWWVEGKSLYLDWLKPAGFTEIRKEQAKPGDGFLMSIRSPVPNHAGLLVADNKVLHHLPTRLSRAENAGIWGYQAELWVRFTGKTQ